MTADFRQAQAKVAAHEAGFANDSRDSGGLTWAGIALKKHPSWKGWARVDAGLAKLGLSPAATLDAPKRVRDAITAALRADPDLAALVDAFYLAEFWEPLGLQPTDEQEWADYAYDKAVNFGLGPGKQLLEAMRKAGGA